MSANEFKDLCMSDVEHIKEGARDIIKGRIYTIYPHKSHFTDKFNYKLFHIIYVKDMFNNLLAHEKFPSAHPHLRSLAELMHFTPTFYYFTIYYFIAFNIKFRHKYNSKKQAFLYSLPILLGGFLLIQIVKYSIHAYYDMYLREDIFVSEPDKIEEKMLSFKMNTIQYSNYLYKYQLKSRRALYTETQLLEHDMKTKI